MNRLDVTSGRPFGMPWGRPGDLGGLPADERERLQTVLEEQRMIMQALLNAMRHSIDLDKVDPATRRRMEDMQAQLDAWQPKELSDKQEKALVDRLRKLTGGRDPKPTAESEPRTIPENAGPVAKPLLPAGSLPLHEKHPLFSSRPEAFKLRRPLLLAKSSPTVEEVRVLISQSAREHRPLVLALRVPSPQSLEDAKWAHLRGAATVVVVKPDSEDAITKLCGFAEQTKSGLEFGFFPPDHATAPAPTKSPDSRGHGELTVTPVPATGGLDVVGDPSHAPISPTDSDMIATQPILPPPGGLTLPDEWEPLPSSQPEVAPFEPIPGYADSDATTAPCEKVRKAWERLATHERKLRGRKAQLQEWIDFNDRTIELIDRLIELKRSKYREASRYDPAVEDEIRDRWEREGPAQRAKRDAASAAATAAYDEYETAYSQYRAAREDYRNASPSERDAKFRVSQEKHRLYEAQYEEWRTLQAASDAAWDAYRAWDRSLAALRDQRRRVIEWEIERIEAQRVEYLEHQEELIRQIRDEIDGTPDTPGTLAWIEREFKRLERECDEKYSAARTAWREARDRFEELRNNLTAAEEASQDFRRSQRFGSTVASRGPDSQQTAAAAAAATQAMDQARDQLDAARRALADAGRALSQLDQKLEDGDTPTPTDLGAVHQQLTTAAKTLQDAANSRQQGENAFHRLVATSEAYRRAQRRAQEAASAAASTAPANTENPCFKKLLTADGSALLFADPKNRGNYIRIDGRTVTVHAGGQTWTAEMHADIEQWFREIQPGQIKAGLREVATRTANGQETTRSGDVMVAGPDRQNRTVRPGYVIEIALQATDGSEVREFSVSIAVDADDCGSWAAQVVLGDRVTEFMTVPPGSLAQLLAATDELSRRRGSSREFFSNAQRLFLELNAWDAWSREQGGPYPPDLQRAVRQWAAAVRSELTGWRAGSASQHVRQKYEVLLGLLRDGFPSNPVENMEYTREVLQALFAIQEAIREHEAGVSWGR